MARSDRWLLCYLTWCLYAWRRLCVRKRRSRWGVLFPLVGALALPSVALGDGGAVVRAHHTYTLPCHASNMRVRLHGRSLPQDYANRASVAEWRSAGRIVAWYVPDSNGVSVSRTVRLHWWCNA